ncbi:MAG: hypothetical protein QM576_21355 [Rhodopseudomonas sp.]|uniref:hypothetical protein n=1 Tax=Rhodopseudomonas sp. TaxID=1078 RepID=UPI0039E4647B
MSGAAREDVYELARLVKNLMIEEGMEQEALRVINSIIVEFPRDVLFPISKAELYLYYLGDLQEALSCINMAVERAYRAGSSRRMALGVKARILLRMERWGQLSEVLEAIMSLQNSREHPDIGRERDFVDGAPPGVLPNTLLARYNEYCSVR